MKRAVGKIIGIIRGVFTKYFLRIRGVFTKDFLRILLVLSIMALIFSFPLKILCRLCGAPYLVFLGLCGLIAYVHVKLRQELKGRYQDSNMFEFIYVFFSSVCLIYIITMIGYPLIGYVISEMFPTT